MNLDRRIIQQAAQAVPQAPVMNIASPINDVQLIALIAGMIRSKGETTYSYCVSEAQELVLAAIKQQGEFMKKLREQQQPTE